MLATGGGRAFDDEGYGFEVKWDGVRALIVSGPPYRIQNRHLNDVTRTFPELDFRFLPEGTVIDGEIVAFVDGAPSFHALQSRAHLRSDSKIAFAAKHQPTTFMAFDLLYLKGECVEDLPYTLRRDMLRELIPDSAPGLLLTDQIRGAGKAYFKAAAERGLEGVIAKKLDSRYVEDKRSTSWIKIVAWRLEPLEVIGFVQEARKPLVRQVAVGRRERDAWRYLGKVGDLEAGDQALLYKTLKDARPLRDPPNDGPADVQWRDIDLRCHVRYFQETATGRLRHARFKGWAQ